MPDSRRKQTPQAAGASLAGADEHRVPAEVYTRPEQEIWFNLGDGLPVCSR